MKEARLWLSSGWCLALLTATSTALIINSNNLTCCQKLQSTLPGQVHLPDDLLYTASSKAYWSAQEEALKPSCFVNPNSARDVAAALRTLSGLPTCRFAVKSGGHMAHAGAANIQGGITIDLGGLQQFSVARNASDSTVTLGPGLRWGDVYTRLAIYGLAVPGGRSGKVGVGGYLLGGRCPWNLSKLSKILRENR